MGIDGKCLNCSPNTYLDASTKKCVLIEPT